MLSTFKINVAFLKSNYMHSEVTAGCVIFISNKIEDLIVRQLQKFYQKSYTVIIVGENFVS